LDELPEAVLEQRLGETVDQAVEHGATDLAGLYETGGTQEPQGIADCVFADVEGQGKVADAQLVDQLERVQEPDPNGVAEQREHAGEASGVRRVQACVSDAIDPLSVHRSRHLIGRTIPHIRMIARISS